MSERPHGRIGRAHWVRRRTAVWASLVIGVVATGCSLAEERDIARRADVVRDADSPLIQAVALDSGIVDVVLVRRAGNRAARDVWCELLLPAGLNPENTVVTEPNYALVWDSPSDCDDPEDVPAPDEVE